MEQCVKAGVGGVDCTGEEGFSSCRTPANCEIHYFSNVESETVCRRRRGCS